MIGNQFQDLQDRVDAYRGNDAPLRQRYQQAMQQGAMSNNPLDKLGPLLDILALQQIKSEKEAAAHQMQLAMAQKGGMPPTIAQQREQQVEQMTKAELMQKLGPTIQAQGQQSAAAQQRPPQPAPQPGIAGAPGANLAAQPKAMAAGGIVAFAEGGDEGLTLDTAREKRAEALTELRSYGARRQHTDPEGYKGAVQAYKDADAAVAAAQTAYEASPTIAALNKPVGSPSEMGASGIAVLPEAMARQAAAAGAGRGLMQPTAAQLQAQANIQSQAAPPVQAAPAPAPAPAAATQRPPVVRPAAAPAQPVAAPVQSEPSPTAGLPTLAAQRAAANPLIDEEAAIKRLQELYAPHLKEQEALNQEYLAAIKAAQRPPRTGLDKFVEWASNIKPFARGFEGAGMQYGTRALAAADEAERQRALDLIEKQQLIKQKGLDTRAAVLGKAVESGAKKYELGIGERRDALTAGMTSETARQDRIERVRTAELQARAHIEAARINASHNPQMELVRALGGGDLQKGWALAHPTDKKTLLDHFNDWAKVQGTMLATKSPAEQLQMFMSTLGGLDVAKNVKVGAQPTGTVLDAGQ